MQELHNKLSEESKRADTLAFELKRLEEKHEALIKEKEVIFQNVIDIYWHVCLKLFRSSNRYGRCPVGPFSVGEREFGPYAEYWMLGRIKSSAVTSKVEF